MCAQSGPQSNPGCGHRQVPEPSGLNAHSGFHDPEWRWGSLPTCCSAAKERFPQKLLQHHFTFDYPEIEAAVNAVAHGEARKPAGISTPRKGVTMAFDELNEPAQQFLKRLFEQTGGQTSRQISMYDIGAALAGNGRRPCRRHRISWPPVWWKSGRFRGESASAPRGSRRFSRHSPRRSGPVLAAAGKWPHHGHHHLPGRRAGL